MYNYEIKDPKVKRLIEFAIRESWDPYRDLAWDTFVDKSQIASKSRSLIEDLPEYKKMSSRQQEEFKLKESVYHICNLLAGEHKGVRLAAQILLGCPEEAPDWPFFVSTILSDERNHVIALTHYLNEKLGLCYAPHPRIDRTLTSLLQNDSYEIKLFIGQVVLEWTATSLLSALAPKKPEPLFQDILKRIIKDEGRHLMFNRVVFANTPADKFEKTRKKTEDLLYESIVACVSSLCAIPVWQEYGLSLQSCQQYALAEMENRGVIRFYRDILPKELQRCNFYSDRLENLLQNDLSKKIVQDHWTFEPELQETSQTKVTSTDSGLKEIESQESETDQRFKKTA